MFYQVWILYVSTISSKDLWSRAKKFVTRITWCLISEFRGGWLPILEIKLTSSEMVLQQRLALVCTLRNSALLKTETSRESWILKPETSCHIIPHSKCANSQTASLTFGCQPHGLTITPPPQFIIYSGIPSETLCSKTEFGQNILFPHLLEKGSCYT